MNVLEPFLVELPLVAVLRGIRPDEVIAVADELVEFGFRALEVPLNSPDPVASIRALQQHFEGSGKSVLIGAGTVLTTQQVVVVAEAGGQLIVAPNFDPEVVASAIELGLVCLPGVATPSEAFAALAAGATGLKLFPAEVLDPSFVKAIRAVLPRETLLVPTGGITPQKLRGYWDAGVNGFGLGGALYQAGDTPQQVAEKAAGFAAACAELPVR